MSGIEINEFKNHVFQGIIVDPTVLNDAEKLRSFLKSMLHKEYKIAISSDIYFSIKNGEWDELSKLLRNWQWNTGKEELLEWHRSQEFRALCEDFVSLVLPCSYVLEDLNDEEKRILKEVSEIIEPGSPRVVKIVKEFIKTSVVKRFPILSYTKHARRWFKSCKNVIIMEITDAKNSVSQAKENIKRRVEEAGWNGFIFVSIFGLVAGVVLESVLPQPFGKIIGTSGGLVVGVIANGKKIAY
jgi:hypothetical protein